MNRSWRSVVGVAACILATATAAPAQSVTQPFGGAGYSSFNADHGAGHPSIWHTGDFFAQLVTGSGLASVSRLDLGLDVDNFLAPGLSIFLAVLVNGTNVGSLSYPAGPSGFSSHSFTFAEIFATDYTVMLQQTSADIPPGFGAILLNTNGASTLTLHGGTTVPEPVSMALLGTGLAGLAAVRRRRRTQAEA